MSDIFDWESETEETQHQEQGMEKMMREVANTQILTVNHKSPFVIICLFQM